MAKPQKKENVLDQYIKRTGSLEYITANDVQRNAVRIFKDIAFGNIDQKDIEKYSDFFMNANNIENLLIAAAGKRDEASIHCFAMEAFFKVHPDQVQNVNANNLHRRDWAIYQFYSLIFDAFNDLKIRGDIRVIYGLQHNLFTMKRYLPFV